MTRLLAICIATAAAQYSPTVPAGQVTVSVSAQVPVQVQTQNRPYPAKYAPYVASDPRQHAFMALANSGYHIDQTSRFLSLLRNQPELRNDQCLYALTLKFRLLEKSTHAVAESLIAGTGVPQQHVNIVRIVRDDLQDGRAPCLKYYLKAVDLAAKQARRSSLPEKVKKAAGGLGNFIKVVEIFTGILP